MMHSKIGINAQISQQIMKPYSYMYSSQLILIMNDVITTAIVNHIGGLHMMMKMYYILYKP